MKAQRRVSCAATLFAALGGLLLGACHDVTGAHEAKHPIVGTYDLTTALETRQTSTSAPVPAGPAALSGVVTIGDSIVLGRGDTIYAPLFHATATEVEACSPAVVGCTGGIFQRTVEYGNGYFRLAVTGDTMGVSGFFQTTGGEMLQLETGKLAGDSIAGILRWYTYVGGLSSTSYRGRYVARRRP